MTVLIIIYLALGYWAYGYVNSNKVYIYSSGLTMISKKLAMALMLGWLLIPIAILKMIFGRR